MRASVLFAFVSKAASFLSIKTGYPLALFDWPLIRKVISGLLLLCLTSGAANSAIKVYSYSDLPIGAFSALYDWRWSYISGFGPYSSTYPYVTHPGYVGKYPYYANLHIAKGQLAEHPSALLTIFAENEAVSLASDYNGYKDVLALYRTRPDTISIAGKFGAAWDATVWFSADDTVRFVEDFTTWNYSYSGRACPDNHRIYLLIDENGDGVDFFCGQNIDLINNEKNLGESCPIQVGNPIHVATGNKFQHEAVYKAHNESPLRYELFYNSQATKGAWTNTYSRSLSGYINAIFQNYDEAKSFSPSKYLAITVRRQDGRMFRFSNAINWDSRTTEVSQWEGEADIHYRLESVDDPVTGELVAFDLHTPEGSRERYSLKGTLQSIHYADNRQEVLRYAGNGKLEEVADSFGNTIAFSYGADGTTLTVPGGAQYRVVSVGGNVTEIVLPDETPSVDADNPRRQYHYNEPVYTSGADLPNALTGITDERGIRYATYEYDVEGRAIASYHAGNADRVDITYNTDSTRTVTNSMGVATTYTITNKLGMALPRIVTGPACAECGTSNASYNYDPANNNLLSKTENGVTTEYGDYDSNGNYGYKIEALGTSEERRTDYTYDPRFNGKIATITELSVVDGLEKVASYEYDDFGNRTLVRVNGFQPDEQGDGQPIFRTTAYQYNGPLNQLSQIDGPRTDISDITTLNYYPDDVAEGYNRARLKEIIDANDVHLRGNIQYTASGKVGSENRPNGLSLDYDYYPGNDRLEMVTETAAGQLRTTRWTYLATGEVETITQGYGTADATTIAFGYDDARRLVKITDGLGNYIQYTLDTEGNKEGEDIHDASQALRKSLARTFDAYNRLETTSQANETADYHFLPNGNLDTVTDGKSSVTDYDYDDLKRLITATQDLGGIGALTQYDYDAQDNLTSVIDPINGNTTYLYDDLGNLLGQDSPDTGITRFTYDYAGNIKSKQDAKGQQFSYQYDALNRLTLLDAPGEEGDISYGYDDCINGIGRLCSVTMGPATSSPIIVNYSYSAFGEVTAHQGVGYGYDDAGRLSAITYPSGAAVRYGYDAAGQVNRVELDQDGQITVLATDIKYHPFGPVNTLTYGNGQSLSQAVDTAYRHTDITASAAFNQTGIQYDANGNLTDRANDGVTENFIYDDLNRLNEASGIFATRAYQYDKNGNRLEKQEESVVTSYTYDSNSNRMNAKDGVSIMLDANGNTISNGDQTYAFNAHNRLTEASDVTGLLGQYRYNGLGQRLEKSSNGETRWFRYGLNGGLLVELNEHGIQREYVYLNGQPLAVLDYQYIPPSPEDEVLDETAPEVTLQGTWTAHKGRRSHQNSFLLAYGGTDSKARWTPVLDGGVYDVYGWWPRIKKNSTSVPVSIKHADGENALIIDQAATGRDWLLLGRYRFVGDGSEYVELADTSGAVAADSVRWVKSLEETPPTLETAVYYIHNDHLGTPQAMSDSEGAAVWRGIYGPFGQTGVDEDPDGDGKVVSFNLMFPGQYYDRETGLHYNYYRMYDPSTGRYLESDPIGLDGGLNTYAYVYGNPLSFTDPFGLITPDRVPGHGSNAGRGPFGPSCGPEGSRGATWTPDIYSAACAEHDRCYDRCAKACEGLACKLFCDFQLAIALPPYGLATALGGGPTYNDLLKKYGCNDCE